jgi:tetratricopeptide (TPR) repeat protein
VQREGENGEIETVEEEILETITIERPYLLRKGTLAVTFRLANINTGEIVAIKTETAEFSKRAWRDERHQLPGKDQILEELAATVSQRFLGQIHPRTVAYRIDFEENEAPTTELGISYARNGLWEDAQRAFRQAANAYPRDATAQYNLALASNVLGDEYEAERAVERAIQLDPQDKYMRLLSSIRRGDFAR